MSHHELMVIFKQFLKIQPTQSSQPSQACLGFPVLLLPSHLARNLHLLIVTPCHICLFSPLCGLPAHPPWPMGFILVVPTIHLIHQLTPHMLIRLLEIPQRSPVGSLSAFPRHCLSSGSRCSHSYSSTLAVDHPKCLLPLFCFPGTQSETILFIPGFGLWCGKYCSVMAGRAPVG